MLAPPFFSSSGSAPQVSRFGKETTPASKDSKGRTSQSYATTSAGRLASERVRLPKRFSPFGHQLSSVAELRTVHAALKQPTHGSRYSLHLGKSQRILHHQASNRPGPADRSLGPAFDCRSRVGISAGAGNRSRSAEREPLGKSPGTSGQRGPGRVEDSSASAPENRAHGKAASRVRAEWMAWESHKTRFLAAFCCAVRRGDKRAESGTLPGPRPGAEITRHCAALCPEAAPISPSRKAWSCSWCSCRSISRPFALWQASPCPSAMPRACSGPCKRRHRTCGRSR